MFLPVECIQKFHRQSGSAEVRGIADQLLVIDVNNIHSTIKKCPRKKTKQRVAGYIQ